MLAKSLAAIFVKVCCTALFVTLNLLYVPAGILLLLFSRLTDALRITHDWTFALGPRLLRGYNALVLIAFGVRVFVQGDVAAAANADVMLFTHASNLDAPAIAVSLPDNTNFTGVAKHSLLIVPLLGWFFRLGGIIPIRRANLAQAINALEEAEQAVRRGVTVGISPEGTRRRRPSVEGDSPENNLLQFKKGPFHLIRNLQSTNVVLASILGSHRAWGASLVPRRGSCVVVRFSPSVNLLKTGTASDSDGIASVDAMIASSRSLFVKELQTLGGKRGSLEFAAGHSREITCTALLEMCSGTLTVGAGVWVALAAWIIAL